MDREDMGKCQFCGDPATVHMTQIINNKTTVVRMCSACAAKRGLFDKDGLPFAMLSSLGEALFAGMKQSPAASGMICSNCGCTPASFRETGRLGCPNCYRDLKPLIDDIIDSSQKGVMHKGKRLKGRDFGRIHGHVAGGDGKRGRASNAEKLEVLQEKLEDAIGGERYEEAAKLRDEIRKLKGLKD
jgi:protein arginine kinase activator